MFMGAFSRASMKVIKFKQIHFKQELALKIREGTTIRENYTMTTEQTSKECIIVTNIKHFNINK